MEIKKALSMKSLKELLAITDYLGHNNKRKPKVPRRGD